MNHSQMGTETVSHLGFGCMRFPTTANGDIDQAEMESLIRRAIDGGITYFDTAWPYHEGKSEAATGKALANYPRDSFQIATKLPCWKVKSAQEAIELFEKQLENLQMDYVDFYLLHSLHRASWHDMVNFGVVEALEDLQKQGKIRNLGFSFHDGYKVFEEILTYRKWDFCQIQLNYMDTNHQSGMRGYELAASMGVPMVIMEPLKGGMLAQLPTDISAPFTQLRPDKSIASWGMRFLASLPNIKVILSGMSTMEQLQDNLDTFHDIQPLDADEQEAIQTVTDSIAQRLKNGCTGCRYCLPCPVGVNIPMNFRLWNAKSVFGVKSEVQRILNMMDEHERASTCVACGKCETLCPQNIPIRAHLSLITDDITAFLNK